MSNAERRRLADVYRNAMPVILQCGCHSVCMHLETDERCLFYSLYSPGDRLHFGRFWRETKQGDDCRLIALGFAAAMAEAGDLE